MVRNLLRQLLAQVLSISITGECENARDAIEVRSKDTIDILFLDTEMPGISGIDMLRTLNITLKF